MRVPDRRGDDAAGARLRRGLSPLAHGGRGRRPGREERRRLPPSVPAVAEDFATKLGRPKVASLELTGDPRAETALVTIGTIGETASELLGDDEPLLLARVHAYRPFPADQLAAALSNALHVCVVDGAPAFGAPAPLGEDVRALGICATDVVCGLGGSDVTPDTLRHAIEQTRLGVGERGALYLTGNA